MTHVDPIVAALRQRRINVGMSRAELARQLGITSRTSIRLWEIGEAWPLLCSLRRWAEVLDVNLNAAIPPDIDEIAVHRALAGEQVRLNAAERDAVIATLTRRGHSARQIAAMVGLTQRSVVRVRAKLREVA